MDDDSKLTRLVVQLGLATLVEVSIDDGALIIQIAEFALKTLDHIFFGGTLQSVLAKAGTPIRLTLEDSEDTVRNFRLMHTEGLQSGESCCA